jgi:hypothetical protein
VRSQSRFGIGALWGVCCIGVMRDGHARDKP